MTSFTLNNMTLSVACLLAATFHSAQAQVKSNPLVTVAHAAVLNNSQTGNFGFAFTVDGLQLTVSSLGRYCAPGNTQTHTLKLVRASNQTDLLGGSANVAMAGCSPGAFQYGNLAAPLKLQPNTEYYLLSSETAGGDAWYMSATVSGSPLATLRGPVSPLIAGPSGTWYAQTPVSSISLGPLNLIVQPDPVFPPSPVPTATLLTPAPNSILAGTVGVSGAATPNARGASITSAALNVDGVVSTILTSSGLPGGHFGGSVDTSRWTNGIHLLSLTALDSLGNQTTSPATLVDVQNAPHLDIFLPTLNGIVSGLAIVEVLPAAPAGASIVSVAVLLDGKRIGVPTRSVWGLYSLPWLTSNASNGPHLLTATAVDSLGNSMASTINVTVNNP